MSCKSSSSFSSSPTLSYFIHEKKGWLDVPPVAPYIMYIYGELQRRASPACEGYCCQYKGILSDKLVSQ